MSGLPGRRGLLDDTAAITHHEFRRTWCDRTDRASQMASAPPVPDPRRQLRPGCYRRARDTRGDSPRLPPGPTVRSRICTERRQRRVSGSTPAQLPVLHLVAEEGESIRLRPACLGPHPSVPLIWSEKSRPPRTDRARSFENLSPRRSRGDEVGLSPPPDGGRRGPRSPILGWRSASPRDPREQDQAARLDRTIRRLDHPPDGPALTEALLANDRNRPTASCSVCAVTEAGDIASQARASPLTWWTSPRRTPAAA